MYLPTIGQYRRADVEVAVRGVGAGRGLARGLHYGFEVQTLYLHKSWKAAVVTRTPTTAPITTW